MKIPPNGFSLNCSFMKSFFSFKRQNLKFSSNENSCIYFNKIVKLKSKLGCFLKVWELILVVFNNYHNYLYWLWLVILMKYSMIWKPVWNVDTENVNANVPLYSPFFFFYSMLNPVELFPKAFPLSLSHVCWLHNSTLSNLFIMLDKSPCNLTLCALICMLVHIPGGVLMQ